jgi:hypothetical protein
LSPLAEGLPGNQSGWPTPLQPVASCFSKLK